MKGVMLAGLALAGLAGLLATAGLTALVARAATQAVSVQDNQYVDGTSASSTTTIAVGDTVQWTWTGANPHTVDSSGGSESFSSGPPQTSGTFSHTFTTAGTYSYICGVHGTAMQGTVAVNAPAAATNTSQPQPSSTPVPNATNAPRATSTAAATSTNTPASATTAPIAANTPAGAAASATTPPAGGALPATGSGGSSSGGSPWGVVVPLSAIGLLGVAGAVFVRSRRSP